MEEGFVMKKLIMAGIILLATNSWAGWQSDIATNQNLATNYISELRVNPAAQRPQLIQNSGWQSQRSLAEIYSAMDRAEQLSRAGRPDLIERPQFQYGVEKDRRQQRY